MFTSRLPNDDDYRVVFSTYAERHFIKRFAKSYKGRQWLVTRDSIFQDLKRIHVLQETQQVDQLKSGNDCILLSTTLRWHKPKYPPKHQVIVASCY